MSSGFSISKERLTADPNPSHAILENWDVNDVIDVCGKTPFDNLLTDSERREIGGDDYLIKIDVVSAMLSFIFQPVKGYVPSTYDVSMRAFVLAAIVNPSLINNLSLRELGELFGTSKQTVSARLTKMSGQLGIRARASKGSETCKKFSDIGKERWRLIKEEERRQYLKDYRAKNQERLNLLHKEYYAKNRDRILKSRKAKRRGK